MEIVRPGEADVGGARVLWARETVCAASQIGLAGGALIIPATNGQLAAYR